MKNIFLLGSVLLLSQTVFAQTTKQIKSKDYNMSFSEKNGYSRMDGLKLTKEQKNELRIKAASNRRDQALKAGASFYAEHVKLKGKQGIFTVISKTEEVVVPGAVVIVEKTVERKCSVQNYSEKEVAYNKDTHPDVKQAYGKESCDPKIAKDQTLQALLVEARNNKVDLVTYKGLQYRAGVTEVVESIVQDVVTEEVQSPETKTSQTVSKDKQSFEGKRGNRKRASQVPLD